jgi:hypothetical protein
VKRIRYFNFSFSFFEILEDKRFIFVSSSLRRFEIDRNFFIKYCFVACYIHNIHGWSIFLTLLHVTMWIWIEMERKLIAIIDDWRNEGYCMDLERN